MAAHPGGRHLGYAYLPKKGGGGRREKGGKRGKEKL